MSANCQDDPESNEAIPTPTLRRGLTIVELLVAVGVIALLLALLMPRPLCTNPAGARRAQCINNLKQIGLALHNYERDYQALPPAFTVAADGRALHSWRTLILPYLEQTSVYQAINLTQPWNHPANTTALNTTVAVYCCPEEPTSGYMTTYLAIVGPEACFLPDQPRRLDEITDARGSTLAVIEAADDRAVPWMAPMDADQTLVMRLGRSSKLHDSRGTNALLVDGSVRFLKANLPGRVRHALTTISGNDEVSADEW